MNFCSQAPKVLLLQCQITSKWLNRSGSIFLWLLISSNNLKVGCWSVLNRNMFNGVHWKDLRPFSSNYITILPIIWVYNRNCFRHFIALNCAIIVKTKAIKYSRNCMQRNGFARECIQHLELDINFLSIWFYQMKFLARKTTISSALLIK